MAGGRGMRYEVLDVDSMGQHWTSSGRHHDDGKRPEYTELERPTSRRTQFPKWANFWLLPVLGGSYLAHVRFRRYSPRRLPPLTSMKFPETYTFLLVSWTIVGIGEELKDEVLDDPDLHLIEMVARDLKKNVFSVKSSLETVDQALDSGAREILRNIRNTTYADARGIGGKLAWWHNHIWSREETWYRAAVIWNSKFGAKEISSTSEYDRCITHLANTFQTDDDEFEYSDYGLYSFIPFFASVPFAMAARWTQRRAFFLPLNGLQRLFLWATLYPDSAQHYQHYAYLRGLKRKREIAQLLRGRMGLDPRISRMVT